MLPILVLLRWSSVSKSVNVFKLPLPTPNRPLAPGHLQSSVRSFPGKFRSEAPGQTCKLMQNYCTS